MKTGKARALKDIHSEEGYVFANKGAKILNPLDVEQDETDDVVSRTIQYYGNISQTA
jgi:hypothetical protein